MIYPQINHLHMAIQKEIMDNSKQQSGRSVEEIGVNDLLAIWRERCARIFREINMREFTVMPMIL
jgi:hypothetical protein